MIPVGWGAPPAGPNELEPLDEQQSHVRLLTKSGPHNRAWKMGRTGAEVPGGVHEGEPSN